MPDPRGWPDQARPGVPPDPDQERPHLIEDEHGKRRWFLWMPAATTWVSGPRRCNPSFAGKHWRYAGLPAANREQTVLAFFKPPHAWLH
jgi:hypothetical protein